MKIKSIEWKNFNGYGNIPQRIDFKEDGMLYLLVGSNGSGKSSIAEVITFALYGKVAGKRIGDLSNRINQNTEITINLVCKGKTILIKRGIKPNFFDVFIDGVLYDQAGNRNVQEYLETELYEIPYQVFKNIIILSINDFKSFLTMSNGDKRNIVDRLFGFSVLNTMRDLIRDRRKDLKRNIQTLYDELNVLQESIHSIEDKIELLKNEKKIDQSKLIQEYEEKIDAQRRNHLDLSEKLKKLNNRYNKLEKIVKEKTRDESEIITNLKSIKKKVELYKKDKCPTCGFKFEDDKTEEIKENLKNEAKDLQKNLNIIRGDLEKVNNGLIQCNQFIKNSKDSITKLENTISNYAFELNMVISKSENKDFQYLKQLIVENTSKTKEKSKEKHQKEVNDKFFEIIENILGDDGVKNLALKTILPTLNSSIGKMAKQMHIPHRIQFDEKFDCKITSLGEEINPKTMSTGERKKTDFVIIIAMIKMLKMRYPGINMLFLDEIFSSVDGSGIHEIIYILKDTIKETGLNTWVINHSELPVNLFDIRVDAYKEGSFSKISMEKIN